MLGPKFGTVKSFYKNQIIFKEGHQGNVGYLIKTGQVVIYKIIENKKKILSQLGPGEVFGEMGIITESPRNAFAEAAEYSELVVIDKDSLLKMLKQSPKMIQAITLFLMKRLSSTLVMLEGKEGKSEEENLSDLKAMLSIASLLELMSIEASDVNFDSFCERALDIAGLNQTEVRAYVQQLIDLEIVHVSGELKDAGSSDATIAVHDSKSLVKSIKRDLARRQRSGSAS